MKKLILVSSPPACGKTYISKRLAANLGQIVYLDKDALIPLSKQIFRVAKKPYDRSSDFFDEQVRDYEYQVIFDLAFEALRFADRVLINAPFTRELRDEASVDALKTRLAELNAKLVVVWIATTPEVCRARMIKRNSDRDGYKISHWDEYIRTVDFSAPVAVTKSGDAELLIFYNSSEAEFLKSMHEVLLALGSEHSA